ncbi:MAG: cysteine hydrolase [Lachnospiraceae bacterium]|nr:cysteine hydrolase [Lachnospiraceae bacterium]
MRKVLIVIDMQNDFVSGTLGTAEAQLIVRGIRKEIDTYRSSEDTVIFTQDTHQEDYLETQEGTRLPVKHCIQGTSGWDVVKELEEEECLHICKPSFGYTGWKTVFDDLYKDAPFGKAEDEIELTGVCTDICVVSNALILKAAFPETRIVVRRSLCAATTPAMQEAALSVMKSCQVDVLD